ncbi:YdcH family protein [Amaricoccus tamworthensis]|uniref:YdcH family protein n=1 Tax=Amaricoccus tamworthensis TaxID=57002 RepID=UPI003C7DF3FC
MNAIPTPQNLSLAARASLLNMRKKRLERDIATEMGRPLPCNIELGRLKRSKLRLKDEIASIDGVLSTLQRVGPGHRLG